MTEPRPESAWLRRVPLLAALCVLLVGAVYASALDRTQRFGDERDYLHLGWYLCHEGRFTVSGERPTAYRAPGYPVLLAALTCAGRSGVVIRMANFALLAGTILVGSRFLARRGLPRAAALAAVLCAVYPPFVYTAGTIYPQTLAGLLLAVFYLLLPDGARAPGAGRGALLGLVGIALTMTVPTFLPAVGLGLAWCLVRWRARAAGAVLVALACVAAGLGAWGLRNERALGAFVPLATNSGRNLALGNSPRTTATSGVNVDLSELDAEAAELDEVARDRLYRDAAVAWIRAEPLAALRLYALKVLNHFNVVNTYATDEELGFAESLVLALFFVPLFAVFLWRLARWRRTAPFAGEGLLVVVYFAMALVTAVFFTRIRFRLPLDHSLLWVVAAFLAGDRRTPAQNASR